MTCPHPADRQHAGNTYDPGTNMHGIWIACMDCGALLQSAYSKKTRALLEREEVSARVPARLPRDGEAVLRQ